MVYCGYLVNHWGHFLVEAVNRLWYALKNDQTVDKYVFFLDEGQEREIKGNYKEFFQLLKIWDKVELINTPTKYPLPGSHRAGNRLPVYALLLRGISGDF